MKKTLLEPTPMLVLMPGIYVVIEERESNAGLVGGENIPRCQGSEGTVDA